jgi:hypothetical protein
MPQNAKAQRRLVIVLAFLLLFNTFLMALYQAGLSAVPAILNIVVLFGAVILVLIYLPKMKW